MNIRIYPGKLTGKVSAVSSKSDAHRILICSALSNNVTKVNIEKISKDIQVTIDCLKALGSQISNKESVYTITPIWDNINRNVVLDCCESGSILRFLFPLATHLCDSVEFIGQGRLPHRPMDIMVSLLSEHGCSFDNDSLPIKAEGKITSGKFVLPGNVSSQYVTGLLFVLPLLNGDSEISFSTPVESQGYIDMTIKTLKLFNIKIEKTNRGYFIQGCQKYVSPEKTEVEGDWSSAAFWIGSGAINSTICCENLLEDSLQGDKEIIELVKRFGGTVSYKENYIINPSKLNGIDIDASNIPDLVPILSVIACYAEGKTHIYNASRLRFKESDRLSAITDNLGRLGIKIEEDEDSLTIYGATPTGGIVSGYNDHRIVMSMAILASMAAEPIIIEGAEAVDKSYPEFFEDYKALGGKFDVL